MPEHRRAGSSRLLENGDLAVMLQELNLVPRPDPEAIAQFLGQRYLSLGTQNGHRWSLARMTKNTMGFTSCQKVKIVGLVPRRRPLPVRPSDLRKMSSRKASRIACLSACTLHFVALILEVTHWRCNTQLAFGEHRAHTAFTPAGHPAMHAVQFPGTCVPVVTRP